MADVAKILRLVEEGVLSPEEADQVLSALSREEGSAAGAAGAAGPAQATVGAPGAASAVQGPARHLRIEISEHGRKVVNLRVPINIASFAAGIVPGLPDADAERIRETIRTGARGALVDINSDDGSRVLIVSE